METLINEDGTLRETARYDVLVALYDSFIDRMYDKEKWDNYANIIIGDNESDIYGEHGFMNLIITYLINGCKSLSMNISNHTDFMRNNSTFMINDECRCNYDWLKIIFHDIQYTSPKIAEFRELQRKYKCRFDIKCDNPEHDDDDYGWVSGRKYHFLINPLDISEHL